MSKARDDPPRKFGAGHAEAMGRLGLRELRELGSFQPTTPQSEYGLYGTLTPGEVAESRRSDERDLDEEPKSALADALRRAEARDDPGREARELEKE